MKIKQINSKVDSILTHDFILACGAQFVFGCFLQLLVPTLPIYFSKLGLGEIQIGVLMGLFGLSSVALRPFVGKALTKVAEKRFMVGGSLINVAMSLGYMVAPSFWPLLILRTLQGIGFAFHHTASMTLVAHISPAAHRARTLGYFSLALNISSAVAPPFGISLINRYSFTSLFLTCAGLAILQLILSQLIRKRGLTAWENPSTEESFFISRKAIPPAIVASLALFMWAALTAFFPLFAIAQQVSNPGLFFTTMAVMLILGRGLGGKFMDTHRKEKVIMASLVLPIIAMTILAFSKTMPLFILVAAIWGIGHAFLMPSLTAYTLDRVSSAGQALGTFTAVADLGLFLGPLVMGFLIHYTNYSIMFGCLAFLGTLNLAFFYVYKRTV